MRATGVRAAARAAATEMTNRPADFVGYFKGIRKRTQRLVPLVPPERIEWPGQLYLMLRLIGVATPPMFGLTSKQVRGYSLSDSGSAASTGLRVNRGSGIDATRSGRLLFVPEPPEPTTTARKREGQARIASDVSSARPAGSPSATFAGCNEGPETVPPHPPSDWVAVYTVPAVR
ncbi:MAG: hypothetical protein H0W08_22660 [Acidobacteria bacterium]|nr:hypothetical protein [Acidobacteriota bacterium]